MILSHFKRKTNEKNYTPDRSDRSALLVNVFC